MQSRAALCRKKWLRIFTLAFVGVLARTPAITGSFVWDDGYLATDNPFIKSPLLALEAFRHFLFLDSFSPHYRPVQNLSFMVDYYFWNNNPAGFHLTNILLHVGSGLLLYRLLLVLFGRMLPATERAIWGRNWGPFLVAMLWMVHPVHSAAVDYISGRADSLAFFFACASWLLVLRAQEGELASNTFEQEKGAPRQQRCWLNLTLYFGAGFLAVLSLCSREIGLVWVFLFLVYTFAFERGSTGKTRLLASLGCVIVIGAYVFLHHLAHDRPTVAPEPRPLCSRTVLMLRALGDYGRLLVFPANLHMERSVGEPAFLRNQADWRSAVGWEYLSIVGSAVAAVFAWGCLKSGTGQRLRWFGTTWFVAAFLPISNIVALNATVAEHWLYLPSVGFLLFLAGCAVDAPRSWRKPITAIALLAMVALSVRSWIRSTDWRDEQTFYERTYAAGGNSCRVAINLALSYARQRQFAKAEKILRPMVAAIPNYPNARNTLAAILSAQGKAEAESLFSAAAERAQIDRKEYPRTWLATSNLARMRVAAHDEAGAIAILEQARADYPQVWELISLESELLRRIQGPRAAMRLVQDFARRNWWHHAAALAEGKLYAENDDAEDALAALHRAALLDVHDTEALNLTARIRLRQNRFVEAYAAQKRAVARQPDEPRQYAMLSDILDQMGRQAEARVARANVSRLQALAVNIPAAVP